MTTTSKGLCGYTGTVPVAPDTLAMMERCAWEPTAAARLQQDDFSASTPTGWVAESDGIAVVLYGVPYFFDRALQAVADKHNPAQAILESYQNKGTGCIRDLRGAFAVALQDSRQKIALLATDRLARKTLYYAEDADGFVFASNANVVRQHPRVESEINPQSIFNYVYFHMVPGPETIYTGIKKLPAAHCVINQAGKVHLQNYWQPDFEEISADSPESLHQQLHEVLYKGVERLASQGNVGAFLSGGLDSSSVVGMLAKNNPEAPVFSIGFDAEGYDEMAYAKITAQHFNMRQHAYYVTREDVVNWVPKIAAHYDEPFGNSSVLPTFMCAKLAAENGVDCLLAGDGGDELFSGNERYVKQGVFEHYWRLPSAVRKGFVEPLAGIMPNKTWLLKKAKSYIEQARQPLPDRLQTYNFLHLHSAGELFESDFLSQVNTAVPLQLLRDVYHRPDDASQLNRMLYLDWQFTLADNDLRKVNHMCSLGGVDVVYPMLDDELLEFSCRVPSSVKMPNNQLRHFYKQAMLGFLPDETINKGKHGFGLPFGVWLKTHKPLQELCYDNLLKLKQRGYIRPDFIDNAIAMHKDVHAAFYGELMWVLMMLELWLSTRDNSGN